MSDGTLRKEVQRRVYEHEVNGEATFRMEGPLAVARAEEVNSFTRVDDISRGKVALVTASDDPDATSYVRLEPDASREIGEALIAAAEYAAEQGEDE